MPQPTKALLCLHGTGSTAPIFRMQLAKFRLLLKHEFEFVFMNAPFPAPPGPGVLPVFAGAGPFQGRFGPACATNSSTTTSIDGRLGAINDAVCSAVVDWAARRPDAPIVGLLAFSEGALVASLLVWQQQVRRAPWLLPLRFAALICCFFPDEAAAHMRAVADDSDGDGDSDGNTDARIHVPTLHVHGHRDFCLARARKLVRDHCRPDSTHVIEFEGGHQVPSRPQDCGEITRHILKLARAVYA